MHWFESATSEGVETAMYERILVAIDAAPDSPDDSLQRTIQFAKMTGGTVHLLHFAVTWSPTTSTPVLGSVYSRARTTFPLTNRE